MKSKSVREPSGTWWKVQRYHSELTPLEVVYFTASFVTYLEKHWSMKEDVFQERRESRDDIFPSFLEAKTEAIRRAENKVESAKQDLRRYRSELGQWKSLKEPEV